MPEINFDRKSAGFGSIVSFQYRIMWVGCFHFSIVSCSSILPFITNISTILISVKSLCFKNSSRNFALHCSTVFGMLFASTENKQINWNYFFCCLVIERCSELECLIVAWITWLSSNHFWFLVIEIGYFTHFNQIWFLNA